MRQIVLFSVRPLAGQFPRKVGTALLLNGFLSFTTLEPPECQLPLRQQKEWLTKT